MSCLAAPVPLRAAPSPVCARCIQGHEVTLNAVEPWMKWTAVLVKCTVHDSLCAVTCIQLLAVWPSPFPIYIFLFFSCQGPGSKITHLYFPHKKVQLNSLLHFVGERLIPTCILSSFLSLTEAGPRTLYMSVIQEPDAAARWIRGRSEMKSSYLTYFTVRISKWHNLKREET